MWHSENAQEGLAGSDPRGDQLLGSRTALASSYHPIAIVLAALIGAAAMTIAVHAYQEWRARVAISEVFRASNEAMRKMQLELAQQQRDEALRQQARQAQIERQAALKVQASRDQQQMDEEARRVVNAAADRKERAWAKFYQKPARCSEAASMECANGFIRAQRTFEDKYARGEL